MKKLLMITGLFALALTTNAQQEDEETTEKKGGFKKERVFVGASLGLGFSTGVFNVGVNPEVGYSITNWLDAGISTNFNYTAIKSEYNNGYRQRSTIYGVGTFLRVYPIQSIFIQVLPEYNWINNNYRYVPTGNDFKYKDQAPSLLAGIGYGGRVVGQSGFFTVLMFDLGNNSASPYINTYTDNNGNLIKSKTPILRTGFNIYLGPKRRK